MADTDRSETLRFIAATIFERLRAQRTAIERMETKGTILVGFTVAAAQFVIVADGLHNGWRIAALAAFALSFAFGIVVIRPYRHNEPPDPVQFYDIYRDSDLAEVLGVLSATRAAA